MAGDYPELRSGGERRACQCVISRPGQGWAGLGGKWHCDGRHRPGWGDLCLLPAPSSSSAHILIGVLLQAPSHCLVTTPQMGTCHHHHHHLLINYTSGYCSTILDTLKVSYPMSPIKLIKEDVVMLILRLKALSAKRIFTIH